MVLKKALSLAILLLLTLTLADLASAHASLVSSSPANNDNLSSSPAVVKLTFSEALDTGYSRIQVFNGSQGEVDKGDVTFPSPTVMQVSLPTLPEGAYSVKWKSLSAVDGHPSSGYFVFTVGNAAGGGCAGCQTSSPPPALAEVAARWGAYLFQALVVGSFGFILLVWLPAAAALDLPIKRSRASPSFVDVPTRCALLGLVASVGLLASLLALLAIFSQNALDVPLTQGFATAVGSSYGRTLALRIGLAAALGVVTFGMRRATGRPRTAKAPRAVPAPDGGAAEAVSIGQLLRGFRRPEREDLRPLWRLSLLGVLLSLGSVAAISVASHGASSFPPVGTIVDFLHLAALSLWIGGLFSLTLAAMPKLVLSGSPRSGALTAEVAGNFSALGTAMVGVVVLSGTYLSVVEVGSVGGLLGTLYGQVLLVKLAMVVPLVALGAYNHFRLRPALAYTKELEDDSRVHRRRFLLTTRTEALLGAAILVAAGLLTALTPAATQTAPLPAEFVATRTVSPITVNLTISPYPSTPGTYTFSAFLYQANDQSLTYGNATGARLELTPPGGGTPTTIAMEAGHGTYHWLAETQAFPTKGTWGVAVVVDRTDGPSVKVNFVLNVT